MKTYTPDLDPAALARLGDYAALFAVDFPRRKPALWAGVYLQGLLLACLHPDPSERPSPSEVAGELEPLLGRLPKRAGLGRFRVRPR